MGRTGTGVLALGTGIGAAVLLVTGTTAALGAPGGQPQVTLCHATPPDTAAQGYVEITIDANAVFRQGHDSEHDEDIIPAFEYTDPETGNPAQYPGKNLDDGGQAILDNGCQEAPPPTTTAPPPTTTEPPPTTTEPPPTTTEPPPTTTEPPPTTTEPPPTTTEPPPTTTEPPPTTTEPPPTTTAPGPTTPDSRPPAGPPPGNPGGRQIPSGPVDAGGGGLYDNSDNATGPAAILLMAGGVLLAASTALTVRWRRYSR